MLEGLDAIDWRGLPAYGDSTRIPDLIRTLGSEDGEVRQEALDELFQTIWHQGDVYPSTYHAIPFLIEWLRGPSYPGKVQVLNELASLVDCYSGPVSATLEALESGMPSYRESLADADWRTRLAAAGALGACCRGRREIVARDLLEALAVEPGDRAQLGLLLLLGGVAGEEQAGILRAIVDAEPEAPTAAGPRATRPIRWAAAMSWTLVAREQTPMQAIRLLATTFDDPGPIDEALETLPGNRSSAAWVTCETMTEAGVEIAAPVLIDALSTVEGSDVVPVIWYLLKLAFPGFQPYSIIRPHKGRAPESLEAWQRTILGAILACDGAWTARCDPGRHLRDLGIPARREELRAALER